MESLRKSMKRTANFTAVETDLLIALVKKYNDVVECLKTDSVNARMKKDAWLKIESEFNCEFSETFRTAAVLKNKYENIKRNVKKQYADEITFSRGTGGGPSIFVLGGNVSKKQKLYQDKITDWASTRASFSEQQKDAFIEQHKLKMKLMKEKLIMMKEKHTIELENLKLQNEILKLEKDKLLN